MEPVDRDPAGALASSGEEVEVTAGPHGMPEDPPMLGLHGARGATSGSTAAMERAGCLI